MPARLSLLSTIVLIGVIGCTGGTLGPYTRLALSTPPDFSAAVTRAYADSGNGPNGFYSQYDVWLAIPPGSAANAGLTVGARTPVFIRTRGSVFASTASALIVGDRVEVWHGIEVVYGAVEGPPGAPLYAGIEQLVIDR